MTINLNPNNPIFPIAQYQADLEAQLEAERVASQQLRDELLNKDDIVNNLKEANDALYSSNVSLKKESDQIVQRLDALVSIIDAGMFYMLLNVPYVFGAEYENNKAFDCSSFMQRIFKDNGIKLPRTSRQQATVGVEITTPMFGDLLFFDTDRDGTINHVGICLGGDYMLHTAKAVENINVCNYKTRYGSTFVTARRVI